MMTDEPRKCAPKTRGRPFKEGNAGKPKGARHRTTILAEKLMGDEAEAIVKAVIKAAKGGDMQAARIVVDRIAPLRKGRPVAIELSKQGDPAKAPLEALAALWRGIVAGDLTPEEAATLASVIEAGRKIIETVELAERIKRLEEGIANGKPHLAS